MNKNDQMHAVDNLLDIHRHAARHLAEQVFTENPRAIEDELEGNMFALFFAVRDLCLQRGLTDKRTWAVSYTAAVDGFLTRLQELEQISVTGSVGHA
jgi:hypothetical protein